MILFERPRYWDRALWFRSYTPGGFDGWRTLGGRKLPCQTMHIALTEPRMQGECRRLAAKRLNWPKPPAKPESVIILEDW